MGLPAKSTLSYLLAADWPHPAKQNNGTPNAAPARTIAQVGQGRRRNLEPTSKNRAIALWQRFDLSLENGIV